ncbi:MAG: glycosyltransferase family A protein [Thermodesulfobacteriota bacterium]
MAYPSDISVIIPTFNRAEHIRRAVESVLCQNLPCSEIIIVDDGSTDDTEQIVASLKKESAPEIRYIHQTNKGPAAARNTGIRNARSSFIAFLDSDDHWQKKKLAIQFRAMEEEPQYLISHTFERWLRRGEHLNQKKIHIPRPGDIFDHCLLLCGVGMSTVLVRKRLFDHIGLFNEDLPCCEDYDFWLRVSSRYPFLLVKKPLTVKEGGRPDQVSEIYRLGMDRFRIKALVDLIESGGLNHKQQELSIDELLRKCSIYGNGCRKHGNDDEHRKINNIINNYKVYSSQ